MKPSRDKRLLYPPFAAQLELLEAELSRRHLEFALYMAFRTEEDQEELYAQGRTKPGRIVTNARGGDSWHNYGLASDYVGWDGAAWSWDITRYDFRLMASIAQVQGLEAGFYWRRFPDPPHIQNTFGLHLFEAKELLRQGGVKAVWQTIDKLRGQS